MYLNDIIIEGMIFADGAKTDVSPSPSVSVLEQPAFTPNATPTPIKAQADPLKSFAQKEPLKSDKEKLSDPSMATYLDVAVLRCLFTSQWLEEGVDWALNYMIQRRVPLSPLTQLNYVLGRSEESVPSHAHTLELYNKCTTSEKKCTPCSSLGNFALHNV